MEWILMSEKSPSKDGRYLVTQKLDSEIFYIDILSWAKNLYKIDKYDFYNKRGKCGWFNYDNEYGYYSIDMESIKAWMPLPEPYKE